MAIITLAMADHAQMMATEIVITAVTTDKEWRQRFRLQHPPLQQVVLTPNL
jgi:hypothetical protein